MNTFIQAHVSGSAFRMEQSAYDRLQAYIKLADVSLATDDDRPAILTDLEQVIADKLSGRLHGHKDVITADDMASVLEALGPVDHPADNQDLSQTTAASVQACTLRRLHTVPDGALVSGVCNGLAAFFGVDVVLVRVAFLMLTVFSGGSIVVVYAILAVLLPQATTSERLAQAYGRPLTARQVVASTRERLKAGASVRRVPSPRRPLYILTLAGISLLVLASIFSLQHILTLIINPFGYRGGALGGLYRDRLDVLPMVVPYLFIWPLVYLALHNGSPRQGRHYTLIAVGGWILWLVALASLMIPALID